MRGLRLPTRVRHQTAQTHLAPLISYTSCISSASFGVREAIMRSVAASLLPSHDNHRIKQLKLTKGVSLSFIRCISNKQIPAEQTEVVHLWKLPPEITTH